MNGAIKKPFKYTVLLCFFLIFMLFDTFLFQQSHYIDFLSISYIILGLFQFYDHKDNPLLSRLGYSLCYFILGTHPLWEKFFPAEISFLAFILLSAFAIGFLIYTFFHNQKKAKGED